MKIQSLEKAHTHEGLVRLRVCFDKADLHLKKTPFGVTMTLGGCTTFGEPGGPALPRISIHIAVPEGAWPARLEVQSARTIKVTDEPIFVAPIQPLRPGAKQPPKPPRPDTDQADCEPPPTDCDPPPTEPRDEEDEDEFVAEPFPAPPVVPPDPKLYEQATRDPTVGKLTGIQQIGLTPVVRVELRPVQLSERGALELLSEIEVTLAYGPRPERQSPGRLKSLLAEYGIHDVDVERLMPMPEPQIVSRAQAKRLSELAKALVVNPEMVVDRWDLWPLLELPADYLIITDNQTWNAATITPTGSVAGDMVAAFQGLAAWKRSRGVTAKVVTVTNIVRGRYGDFVTGSRDLQEVIRRFLKWAHANWGVAWVLLGGDLGVVPARLAAGAVEGHMDVGTTDPPDNNVSFWTGSFLKMHVVNPGTWWPGDWAPMLTNAGTGQVIPFDATGASATSGLGWYYTTTNSYATRSTMRTEFVRVNGPAAAANARLQWLYQWNLIPTDFYYASLTSWVVAYLEVNIWFATLRIPYIYVPPHDWDALDNGLYGQFVGGQDVDGVVWQTDVSVGRAPVQSATEAGAFVDKVIAYEKFVAPDGTRLNGDWPRRILLASSNWDDPVQINPTASATPGDNQFHTGTPVTVCKLQAAPGSFDFQLIADITDSDRRELAFNINGGTAPGWYFARSDADHTPSTISIPLPWQTITFPIPSQWIVVRGTATERNPRFYLFDNVAQDGSMADQEQLREQLRTEIPGWNVVSRLYKDETDLTPVQAAAAPVQHLTSDRVRDALNAQPHIVSLSGHGNSDGCCGAGRWMAQNLTNGWHSFIGYADSCLTNQFDSEDAFSEDLLKNPNGGAVAYVGNSRFSWIGLGDDNQRAFFHRLTSTRHLGLMNDMRCTALDLGYWHAYGRWAIFALNLMGDPEMLVWRGRRRPLFVDIRWHGDLRDLLRVELTPRKPVPPRPPEPPEWLEDVVIHLRQGAFERVDRPGPDGTASFIIRDALPGKLTLTVSHPDFAPFVQELHVLGPLWLTGNVTRVSRPRDAGDDTSIVIETAEGSRSFTSRTDALASDVIVNAAIAAWGTQRPISLLVERGENGSTIIGFRLCADAKDIPAERTV
ncbi:C25 family cysteine peptidase [Pseudomonas sp.]|uniref:C25 family cysteine peptidase n=1 Tax=Pseudomonas sp. TaxID=306 RepID=UPI003D6FB6FE